MARNVSGTENGMTQISPGPSGPGSPGRGGADAAARKRTERTLIFVVVFLGLLMVAGIVAVVLRVIYLSSQPAKEPRASQSRAEDRDVAVPLALPPGSTVKSISLSGDRMAVHYEGGGRPAIAVVDLATGSVVRRVDLVPGSQEVPPTPSAP